MEEFAERYQLFLENTMAICIPDNPMSNISYMGTEMIEALELPVEPESFVLHLNTFHRKTDEKYDPAKDQNEQDFDILVEQPVVLIESGDPALTTANNNLHQMMKYADDQGVQVILGAWMSVKLAYLIPECIGFEVDFGNFSPDENLKVIRETYPERRLYYSMIFTAKRLQKVLAITEGK